VSSGIRIGLDVAVILMAGVLLKVGNWVAIAAPNLSAADMTKVTAWVNGVIQVSLICAFPIMLFDLVRQLRLMLRGKPSQPAAILTVS
jgi:TRAP-type C4-dicarboxylate transport system permease small subunit